MFAAVPRAILDRATIGFPLPASSQPRPGSASQPGCSSPGSASKTSVQPIVGSLQLYFGQTASHCGLLTLPMLEQLCCRLNMWWSGPADQRCLCVMHQSPRDQSPHEFQLLCDTLLQWETQSLYGGGEGFRSNQVHQRTRSTGFYAHVDHRAVGQF
ncbi:hypothetical protein T07_7949 [Trichinella nelsoni]|uniref:Uncharacterized protein n=1 Tax=Trichinella nelsoni TaxID=6336 RepID=A0A0V0S2W0_9BILA|nr:hypothetical protein T07_7949 [Trichinella nelsoni]